MPTRILLIDDDTELCELLVEYLTKDGFSVAARHDGTEGAQEALSGNHSLVVLDVMLPGTNGLDVLRRIRASSKIPVVMLTARGDEVDRIVGLELGADDYLPKPFNPRELAARIRAVQRRSEPGEAGREAAAGAGHLVVGDVELDPGTRAVRRAGEFIELTAVEFTLLEVLLRGAGRVVERGELAKKALGRRLSPFDRSIDVHVSSLRKKLGHEVGGLERIKTVRGVGYLYARPSPG
ncbi:MAG: response regulator transcription factor [Deltaproteobacteria bacterium]|nr:response regulator transcription factor [Deltaproteobacteria bacterium]